MNPPHRHREPRSRSSDRRVMAVIAGVVVVLSVGNVAAEEPLVLTNDDLPSTLSVSVIGPSESEEAAASTWPSLEEIAAIAKLNDDARRQALDSRRRALEDADRSAAQWRELSDSGRSTYAGYYPWFSTGFVRSRHHGRHGARVAVSPHNRDALPRPGSGEGWVGRSTKHLRRAAPVPGSRRHAGPARKHVRSLVHTR